MSAAINHESGVTLFREPRPLHPVTRTFDRSAHQLFSCFISGFIKVPHGVRIGVS